MQTLKLNIKIVIPLVLMLMTFILPASVLAADPCANTTSVVNGKKVVDQNKVEKCTDQSPIVHDIQLIVDFLSVGVGIIVTGVIIFGGIQYILAGDNPQALTAAKQRITNALIALFVFIFTFAFLQWLIPGGVFK